MGDSISWATWRASSPQSGERMALARGRKDPGPLERRVQNETERTNTRCHRWAFPCRTCLMECRHRSILGCLLPQCIPMIWRIKGRRKTWRHAPIPCIMLPMENQLRTHQPQQLAHEEVKLILQHAADVICLASTKEVEINEAKTTKQHHGRQKQPPKRWQRWWQREKHQKLRTPNHEVKWKENHEQFYLKTHG